MQIRRTDGGLQAQTGEAYLDTPPPPSATMCPFPLSSSSPHTGVLHFSSLGKGGMQLCEAGGMAGLGGALLRTRDSVSWRQGGAPCFAPGAWLLSRRAFQRE